MAACEIAEKLRVVILYNRLDSVGRAMTAYAHLTRELECECQPELSVWRLDVATAGLRGSPVLQGAGLPKPRPEKS